MVKAFKAVVLVAYVVCIIIALIYSAEGDKLTAIYYISIALVLFLIAKYS